MGFKPFGVKLLNDALKVADEYLEEYFGALIEIAMGVPRNVPEQPTILMYIQQMEQTHALLWIGGLADQPYIFMIEYKRAYDRKMLHERSIYEIMKDRKQGA